MIEFVIITSCDVLEFVTIPNLANLLRSRCPRGAKYSLCANMCVRGRAQKTVYKYVHRYVYMFMYTIYVYIHIHVCVCVYVCTLSWTRVDPR